MRPRIPLLFLLFAVGSFALPHLAHASILYFGPIIPDNLQTAQSSITGASDVCAAGYGLLIVVINHIIEILISLAIVFVAPLTIAWAGFLFVTSEGNPGKLSQAKGLILNTVVGILVALTAWMIVDALMVALTGSGNGVAKWTSLITANGQDVCLQQAGTAPTPAQPATPSTATPTPSGTPGSGTLTYTGEAQAQVANASAPLNALIACVKQNLTSNAIVTSISDHVITNGSHTIQYCDKYGKLASDGANACAHAANSCHYGGKCGGGSYAVDISSGDYSGLTKIAYACHASVNSAANEGGTHIHLSVGAQSGCGCDTGLPTGP